MKRQLKRAISRVLVIVFLSNIVTVPDTKAIAIPAPVVTAFVMPAVEALVNIAGYFSILVHNKFYAPTIKSGEIGLDSVVIAPAKPRLVISVAEGFAAERSAIIGEVGVSSGDDVDKRVAAAVDSALQIGLSGAAVEEVEVGAGEVVLTQEYIKLLQEQVSLKYPAVYSPTLFKPEIIRITKIPGGARIEFPEFNQPWIDVAFSNQSLENQARWDRLVLLGEINRMRHWLIYHTGYKSRVVGQMQEALDCFLRLYEGDLLERTIAFNELQSLHVDGLLDRLLAGVIAEARRQYVDDNGFVVKKVANSAVAADLIKTYVNDVERVTGKIIRKEELISAELYKQLKSHKNPHHFSRDVSSCIRACKKFDFKKAETFVAKHSESSIFNDIVELYKGECQLALKAARDALYDTNGMAIVAQCDPAYCGYKSVFRNSTEEQKEVINNYLFLRHYFKTMMHEKWGISKKAPACVHDAMYAIMGADFSTLADAAPLQECIEGLVKAASESERKILIDAFYFSNGVLKEYAQHFPAVKDFKFSSKILTKAYDVERKKLNDLICEQIRYPERSTAIRGARELLRHWLKAKNSRDAIQYRAQFEKAYTNIFSSGPVIKPIQAVSGGVASKVIPEQAVAPTEVVLPQSKPDSVEVPVQAVPEGLTDVQTSMPMPPTPQGPELEPEKEIKAKVTFADAEAPGLKKGLVQRISKYKTVKETGENCRIVRPTSDIEAEVAWAPKKWDVIRKCTDDVKKIAKNTGWSEKKIEQIKDHIFNKDHILRDGKMRFHPDPEIASAWDRLYRGDFIKNDTKLLEHEYFELRFESLYKTDYDTAHEAAMRANKIWKAPF